MSKKKIAICISGQSRFWKTGLESFYNFFDPETADYSIFAHTWDINTSKTKVSRESIDPDALKADMVKFYPNLEEILIDDYDQVSSRLFIHGDRDTDIPLPTDRDVHGVEQAVFQRKPTAWLPLFYSAMVANSLKQDYEIKNNMGFDVVVKTRFDNWYHKDNDKFVNWTNQMNHRELYSNLMVFREEYYLPGINDTFYYGNSETMDIVDSFFNSYQNANFFKITKANGRDPALKLVGPNVLLYKWIVQKNIMIKQRRYYKWAVIRQKAANAKWPDDDDFVIKTFLEG
jgi:hypothetical protein